ncbi:hypothetical protein POM88_055033 [Heracleum sosnowskyi]|uniref:Transposase-associated domain-containing protein n=1 Tax=Heracleum sosnowskyi TaxID=360622 RepID=A0AAD8LWH7_9APIA|nr:hypothetical protein POM88_055033 [Heracleum sosnowskyi]
MSDKGYTWLNLPKYTKDYTEGVDLFVKIAIAKFADGNEIQCPCDKCENRFWRSPGTVRDHLICHGPCVTFVEWIYHVTSLKDSNIMDPNIMDPELDTGFQDNFDEMLNVMYGKEIAKKNQESRNKITETHTTGATSFAQIAHKLRLEKLEKLKNLEKTPIDGDAESDADCEELAKVYDADVYVATRKRKDGREYKLPPEVLKTVKDKVVDVEKVLQNEDLKLNIEGSEKSVQVSDDDHSVSHQMTD